MIEPVYKTIFLLELHTRISMSKDMAEVAKVIVYVVIVEFEQTCLIFQETKKKKKGKCAFY